MSRGSFATAPDAFDVGTHGCLVFLKETIALFRGDGATM